MAGWLILPLPRRHQQAVTPQQFLEDSRSAVVPRRHPLRCVASADQRYIYCRAEKRRGFVRNSDIEPGIGNGRGKAWRIAVLSQHRKHPPASIEVCTFEIFVRECPGQYPDHLVGLRARCTRDFDMRRGRGIPRSGKYCHTPWIRRAASKEFESQQNLCNSRPASRVTVDRLRGTTLVVRIQWN